jgi:hypothetical protein
MSEEQDSASRGRREFLEALEIVQRVSPKAATPDTKVRSRLDVESPSEELSKGSLKLRDRKQNTELRMRLATFAIVVVWVQLVAANIFFGYYLYQALQGTEGLDSTVMIAWLSATVVEVIGIVVIVARNLFPGAKGVGRRDMKKIMHAIEN